MKEERVKAMRRRGVALKLASILDITEGLAGVVVGFLLIIIGLLAPTSLNPSIFSNPVEPFLQYFAAVLAFSPSDSLALGFVLMLLGITEIIAGYYLWRLSRLAAILSVVIASIGLALIGAYAVILALAGAFTFIHIASVLAKLGLIAYGWPRLQRPKVRLRRPAKPGLSQAPRA